MITSLLCAVVLMPQQDQMDMKQMTVPPKEVGTLKRFVGNWKFSGTGTQMDGKSTKVTGTAEAKMSVGGRWLAMDQSMMMQGAKMYGHMMVSYSTNTSKYEGMWIDNMSGDMLTMHGYWEGNYFVMLSDEMPDGSGGKMEFKATYQFMGNNKMNFKLKMKMGESADYMPMLDLNYTK